MTKDYEEYLLSTAWKLKRKQAFEHYGKMCSKCNKTKNLQIHHLTYRNIFNEPMEDLMVLCKRHHEEMHGIKPDKIKGKKNKRTHIPKDVKFKPNKNKKANKKRKKFVKESQKPKNFYPALDALIEKKRAREAFRMRVVE